jgi:motility quorum-sensing regulator / GCU-specific mRNA interferase toxin
MDRREKAKPTYPLAQIQAQMVTVSAMNLTRTARQGIRDAGMSDSQALQVVRGLTMANFHKSMPCDHDYRVWQDVYFAEWQELSLYVKFQKAGEYFVISFKESDI